MRNISTFVNVRICCASKKLQTPFYHPGTKVWDVDRTPEVTSDTPGGRPEQGGPGHLQHGGLTCFFYWSTPMQRGIINWGVFFACRCYDSWGTLVSTGHKRTSLGTISSRGVCRHRGYGMRSSLRSSTRCGETSMLTTLSEAGCCCWPASAALHPHPGWTNTCWSKKRFPPWAAVQ